ncbi:HdeD family acid-resistance protein [Pedobacter panaciterrae]
METINLKVMKSAAGYWWLMSLAGALLIGLGLWVLASPVASYLSLSILFAIGMVLTGIFEVLFSTTNAASLKGWGWILAGGMIDFLLGIYLLSYPLMTMIIMPMIIGIWMLFRGFMAIGSSIELKDSGMLDWGWMLATGILIVVCALMILGNPLFGIINIVIWTAISLIVGGIFRIYLSFKLRKLQK